MIKNEAKPKEEKNPKEEIAPEELVKVLENTEEAMRQRTTPDGIVAKFAKEVSEKIKINQLRKFFEKLKEIDEKTDEKQIKRTIYETYPLLAYARGRGLINKNFHDAMIKLLGELEKDPKRKAKAFKEFLISLIAYVKFYGGK